MEWGHIGVSSRFLAVGSTMGPPAAIEYPVEPVGVDTMMPSPPTRVRRPSSVKISSRTTRAMDPFEITASFRAMLLYTCRPSRSTDASSIIRDLR